MTARFFIDSNIVIYEESADGEKSAKALAQRRAELEKIFGKYQADLSGFKFDREEANARR